MAGTAFPEQAKLHEALRQPPPSVAAAPCFRSVRCFRSGAGNRQARGTRTGADNHQARCSSSSGSGRSGITPASTGAGPSNPTRPGARIKTERQFPIRRPAPCSASHRDSKSRPQSQLSDPVCSPSPAASLVTLNRSLSLDPVRLHRRPPLLLLPPRHWRQPRIRQWHNP